MESKRTSKIGNVIRIIDNRTLIINVGKRFLDVGDSIKVYEPLDTLYNLDGTKLCTFEHTKDTLEVIEVNDDYAICQKKVFHQVSPMGLALSPLLDGKKTVYEPLNVRDADIKPLSAKDSYRRPS